MPIGIDHVIVACADPDAAVDELCAGLRLTAGGGGRHETVGTFNRLIWFGDSYLELVGIFDEGLAKNWLFGSHVSGVLREKPNGYAGIAFATTDLAGEVSGLRTQGSPIADPVDGDRVRPDGRFVRWHSALLPDPDPDLGVAFLIEHDKSAAEWTVAERSARAAESHPMGTAVRLLRVEVPVASTARATQRLHKELGLAFRPSLAGGGARDSSLGSQILRLIPSLPGAIPTVVIRGGPEPRSETLLGCRWVVEPA